MKILIASDHAGLDLKTHLIQSAARLQESLGQAVEWVDLGPTDKSSVYYPDFADKVALHIQQHPEELAVLICGSGQGMAMRANKYSQVRAALCWNEEIAKLSREHNNANILCLGARFVSPDLGFQILKTFFSTAFEGGRHSPRVAKVTAPVLK